MIKPVNYKNNFIQFLKNSLPEGFAAGHNLDDLISDQLLSPHTITLPFSVLEKIKSEITAYQKLRAWGQDNLIGQYEAQGLRTTSNFGVANSFDFHVVSDESGQPQLKLIEINTNAAFLAMGLKLYEFLGETTSTAFNEEALVQMFLEDARLAGTNLDSFAIIDEKPQEQRLFIEFLVYQAILKKYQIKADIKDISEINSATKPNTYIYNRYTDFYLEQDQSKLIRELFNKEDLQLSPNPLEYFLLADKKRMLDWQQQSDVAIPKSLLKIYDLGKEDPEAIWSLRKNLFFKPKNSFGSKQVYRGQSISRKVFNEMYGSSMIAQELAVAPELEFGEHGIMKYDIRCYAYQGEFQLAVARLYQGQTTNLRTPGGGFAIVKFQ